MTTYSPAARVYRRDGIVERLAPVTAAPAHYGNVPRLSAGFYPKDKWAAAARVNWPTQLLDGSLLTSLPGIATAQQSLLMDEHFAGGGDPAYFDDLYDWVYVVTELGYKEFAPAVAAQAGVFDKGASDWSAAAAAASEVVDGYFKFRAQAGKMFAIGLQQGTEIVNPGSPFFGFHLGGDFLRDLKRTTSSTAVYDGASTTTSYAARSDSTIYEVRKLNHTVTLLIDGAVFATYVVTPTEDPSGPFRIVAAIFEPGTWVELLEVGGYSLSIGSSAPLIGLSGEGTQPTTSEAAFGAVTVRTGNPAASSPGQFAAISGLGYEGEYAGSAGAFGKIELLAESPTTLSFSPRSAGLFPSLVTTSYVLANNVTASAGQFTALAARGATPGRNAAVASFPAMKSFGYALMADEMQLYTHPFASTGMPVSALVTVDMSSLLAAATTSTTGAVLDGVANTAASAATDAVLSAVLLASMDTHATAGADVPVYDQPGDVWVVSLAEQRATSTFENYAFNSFGVLGGRVFGAKSDGVFLLEGDNDDGTPIRASMSYGKQDFNTKTSKRMISAYVGASSTGKLYLKITVEGKEYIYAARDSSPEIQQQRFDVGRGLAGNYFTFELFNKNGADFEIDSATFVAADFKRRV